MLSAHQKALIKGFFNILRSEHTFSLRMFKHLENISNTRTPLRSLYVPPMSRQPITLNSPSFASITATAYAFLSQKSIDLFPNDDKTRTIVNLL